MSAYPLPAAREPIPATVLGPAGSTFDGIPVPGAIQERLAAEYDPGNLRYKNAAALPVLYALACIRGEAGRLLDPGHKNGGTLIRRGLRLWLPVSGYAVARQGAPRKTIAGNREGQTTALTARHYEPGALLDILADWGAEVGAAAIGWWIDPATGAGMVEATDITEDKTRALWVTAVRGEDCAWDFVGALSIDRPAELPECELTIDPADIYHGTNGQGISEESAAA